MVFWNEAWEHVKKPRVKIQGSSCKSKGVQKSEETEEHDDDDDEGKKEGQQLAKLGKEQN